MLGNEAPPLWLPPVCVCCLSVIPALVFLGAVKTKARNWMFLLLSLLPLALVFTWTHNNRIVSFHGFWHTSVVYQIMIGNIPPNHPLLAGEPLHYPWFPHLFVATISDGLGVSPPTAFALVNVCALLLTMILIFRISQLLYADRIASIFAVFLAIFGIRFFDGVMLRRLLPLNIPPVGSFPFGKFGNINAAPLGILFFALFVYSVLHIFAKSNNVKRHYGTLVISVLGAALFYPYYWLATSACCFSIGIVLCLIRGREVVPKTLLAWACVVVGTLVALPYLHLISSGKSDGAASLMMASLRHVLVYGAMYLFMTLPFLALVLWKRRVCANVLQRKTDSVVILVAVVVTTGLMYVLTSNSSGVEAKFALLSYLSLGILGGVCLKDSYLNQKAICFVVVAGCLLPFGSYMKNKLLFGTRDYSHIVEDGISLRHTDPEQDALYSWIRKKTDRNASFVDSRRPTIALFGQRQVYYAQSHDGQWGIEGWYPAFTFLGYSPEMLEARGEVVDEIYSKSAKGISEGVFTALGEMSGTGAVYIVARDAAVIEKLRQNSHVDKVFESKAAAVFRIAERRKE